MLRFFRCIYENVCALADRGLGALILFFYTSGIIQGCPLAGAMFAICSDPILRAFIHPIDNKNRGVTRACADDIGCSLRHISHLYAISKIFQAAKLIAGLVFAAEKDMDHSSV